MKKNAFAIISSLLLLLFSGCGKEEANPTGVFTAKVDDKAFEARSVIGVTNWLVTDDVYVYGQDNDDNGIEIYFQKSDVQAGKTYHVEDGDISLSYYTSGNKIYKASTGELIVTRVDTQFEATFKFEGEASSNQHVQVTEGKVKTPIEDHQ